jgi:hypothetical protein
MVACFFAGWKAREIAGLAPEAFRISGNVIGVEEDHYRLSVGSDDGVSIGTVFSVTRGEAKLGEIVVMKTLPDSCTGTLKQPTWVETLLAPSASVAIKNGDCVQAEVPVDLPAEELHKIIWNPRVMRAMMNP